MNQIFQENGYLIVKNFFSEEEITKLQSLVEPVFESWFSENEATIQKQQLVNMHSLSEARYFSDSSQRVTFFNELCSTKLIRFLEEICGENLRFNNTQLFFNPTNELKKPYWHRDLQYFPITAEQQIEAMSDLRALHLRIPLLAEKGLELIPGSHRRWDTELEDKIRFEKGGYTSAHPLPDAELIELEPGDILIFNAQMLHKGVYDLNEERKALDICFGNEHPLTIGFINPAVLPTEEEMAKIQNKHWYHYA